jgi:hypothetical protein
MNVLADLDTLSWFGTIQRELTEFWAVRTLMNISAHRRQGAVWRAKNPVPLLRLATATARNRTLDTKAVADATTNLMVQIVLNDIPAAQKSLCMLAGASGRSITLHTCVVPLASNVLWESLCKEKESIGARGSMALAKPKGRKKRGQMTDEEQCRTAVVSTELRPLWSRIRTKEALAAANPLANDTGAIDDEDNFVQVEILHVPRIHTRELEEGGMREALTTWRLTQALEFGIERIRSQSSWHLNERGFFGTSRFRMD